MLNPSNLFVTGVLAALPFFSCGIKTSNGAKWIKNWIEDAFPHATFILDFFHAIEHLHEFIDSYFKEKGAAEKWTKKILL